MLRAPSAKNFFVQYLDLISKKNIYMSQNDSMDYNLQASGSARAIQPNQKPCLQALQIPIFQSHWSIFSPWN